MEGWNPTNKNEPVIVITVVRVVLVIEVLYMAMIHVPCMLTCGGEEWPSQEDAGEDKSEDVGQVVVVVVLVVPVVVHS